MLSTERSNDYVPSAQGLEGHLDAPLLAELALPPRTTRGQAEGLHQLRPDPRACDRLFHLLQAEPLAVGVVGLGEIGEEWPVAVGLAERAASGGFAPVVLFGLEEGRPAADAVQGLRPVASAVHKVLLDRVCPDGCGARAAGIQGVFQAQCAKPDDAPGTPLEPGGLLLVGRAEAFAGVSLAESLGGLLLVAPYRDVPGGALREQVTTISAMGYAVLGVVAVTAADESPVELSGDDMEGGVMDKERPGESTTPEDQNSSVPPEGRPAGPDPTAPDPSGMDPSSVGPSGVGPSGVDPSGVDPTDVDPSGVDPTDVDPSGVDPTGPDPSGVDPTGPDPSGVDPSGVQRPETGPDPARRREPETWIDDSPAETPGGYPVGQNSPSYEEAAAHAGRPREEESPATGEDIPGRGPAASESAGGGSAGGPGGPGEAGEAGEEDPEMLAAAAGRVPVRRSWSDSFGPNGTRRRRRGFPWWGYLLFVLVAGTAAWLVYRTVGVPGEDPGMAANVGAVAEEPPAWDAGEPVGAEEGVAPVYDGSASDPQRPREAAREALHEDSGGTAGVAQDEDADAPTTTTSRPAPPDPMMVAEREVIAGKSAAAGRTSGAAERSVAGGVEMSSAAKQTPATQAGVTQAPATQANATQANATQAPAMTSVRQPPYALLCGSFRERSRAQREVDRLATLGVDARIQAVDIPEKGVWHRVLAGDFSTLAGAHARRYEALEENWARSVLLVADDGRGPVIVPADD